MWEKHGEKGVVGVVVFLSLSFNFFIFCCVGGEIKTEFSSETFIYDLRLASFSLIYPLEEGNNLSTLIFSH